MGAVMYNLRLYVVGKTTKSLLAIENLKAILEDQFKGLYSLEIIDVFENPGLAEGDEILATPTLVKIFPEPIRKVIGDLSNEEKVLLGLDLIGGEQKTSKK